MNENQNVSFMHHDEPDLLLLMVIDTWFKIVCIDPKTVEDNDQFVSLEIRECGMVHISSLD